MNFIDVKKIYSSKNSLNSGISTESEPSLIEKLYNFTFGSNTPKKYVYDDTNPITYTEGTVVYILNEDSGEVVFYKATKDTEEQLTETSVDWKHITVSTAGGDSDMGNAIIIADVQPDDINNKVWYDSLSEVDIDIPEDL